MSKIDYRNKVGTLILTFLLEDLDKNPVQSRLSKKLCAHKKSGEAQVRDHRP